MSRAGVGMVIAKLLIDENLRVRFALDRIETIAERCLRGFELTCVRHDAVSQRHCRDAT